MRERNSQLNGSEIVLLSDGEDNTAGNCLAEVENSGAVIHFIALGPAADTAVIQMSTITGNI